MSYKINGKWMRNSQGTCCVCVGWFSFSDSKAYKIYFEQQTCQNMNGIETHNIPDACQASVHSHFDATDDKRSTLTELFTFLEYTPNG